MQILFRGNGGAWGDEILILEMLFWICCESGIYCLGMISRVRRIGSLVQCIGNGL